MNEQIITEQLKAGVDAHLRGNLLAAENAYKTVLNLDAKNATAHNNLGFMLGQQGDFDNAILHLRQATDLKPDYPTALSNLGQMYFSTGDIEKGLQFLERAVIVDASDIQSWQNLGRVNLLVGNFQRAEYAWWRVHNLQSNNLDALVNLAIAIAAQYRFSEAIKLLESVLLVKPTHFLALLHLGSCELLSRNYGRAQQILLQAYLLNAEDHTLLRHLGLVETCLGDKQQALYYFKKLLDIFPDDENARIDYANLLLDLKAYDLLAQQKEIISAIAAPSERSLRCLNFINQMLAEKPSA